MQKLVVGMMLTAVLFSALPAHAVTSTVANCAELIALGADAGTATNTINLTSDLDCSGLSFVPLYPGGFQGTFDGQDHSISNVTISGGGNTGLFQTTSGATIKNLQLGSGSITGSLYVGGLVGTALAGTTIENVSSDFDISCSGLSGGGLVGRFISGSIMNAASSGNVTGTGDALGGLIGQTEASPGNEVHISQVYATGNVSGGSLIGGIIGYLEAISNTEVSIEDAYATGDVTASNFGAGGIAGSIRSFEWGADTTTVTVARTYASGAVSANSMAGGFVGYQEGVSLLAAVYLEDNFVTGQVQAPTDAGGFIGYNQGTNNRVFSTGNYFDTTTTTRSNCSNNVSIPNCTGVSTASDPDHFMDSANAPLDQWDFATIWREHASSYPTLQADPRLDDDGDGIVDTVEAAGPNSGDANDDAIPDAQQNSVTSFISSVTGKYVALEIDTACAINTSAITTEVSQATADIAYNYPAGLLDFTATCSISGHIATIAVYFSGTASTGLAARKLYASNAYATLPGSTISAATIGGQSVAKLTYSITDGSIQDDDGIANSVIIDPVGLGLGMIGVPSTGTGGLSRQ